jgi:hypothetical protein
MPAGERWSMPGGKDRIRHLSVTFWPIRWPPSPTLQPPDEELARVGDHEVVRAEPVPPLDVL